MPIRNTESFGALLLVWLGATCLQPKYKNWEFFEIWALFSKIGKSLVESKGFLNIFAAKPHWC